MITISTSNPHSFSLHLWGGTITRIVGGFKRGTDTKLINYFKQLWIMINVREIQFRTKCIFCFNASSIYKRLCSMLRNCLIRQKTWSCPPWFPVYTSQLCLPVFNIVSLILQVLRNASSLHTQCYSSVRDCKTDTMCITNSAACGIMFCLPLHENPGNFCGFFWERAELNLHFVTSFHPIPTAVVSVNTGTQIC